MTIDPLTEARNALNSAVIRKRAADRDQFEANREAVAAANALNDAQKAFDTAVQAIRDESATIDSDWGRKRLK